MSPTTMKGRLTACALLAIAAAACGADRTSASVIADADVDSVLAPRITVAEDRTVFTLFAMLNAAGLDDEPRDAMHPVRRAIRGALPRLLSDDIFARVEAFYNARKDSTGAGAYLLAALDTSRRGSLDSLPALLHDFARAFRADSVYLAHQLAYRTYIIDYTAAMRRETGALLRYARVASRDAFPVSRARMRTVVVPNLLMAHDHEITFTLDSLRYSVVGPERVVWFRPMRIADDLVGDALSDGERFAGARAVAATALDSLRNAGSASQADSPLAYLTSNVALAIVLRYRTARTEADAEVRDQAALSALRAGLVFVPALVDALARYEAQGASLRDFLPDLLAGLDAEREIARWREER